MGKLHMRRQPFKVTAEDIPTLASTYPNIVGQVSQIDVQQLKEYYCALLFLQTADQKYFPASLRFSKGVYRIVPLVFVHGVNTRMEADPYSDPFSDVKSILQGGFNAQTGEDNSMMNEFNASGYYPLSKYYARRSRLEQTLRDGYLLEVHSATQPQGMMIPRPELVIEQRVYGQRVYGDHFIQHAEREDITVIVLVTSSLSPQVREQRIAFYKRELQQEKTRFQVYLEIV
jgi:hypothetical protein